MFFSKCIPEEVGGGLTMKYIISESRLSELMNSYILNYLDEFVASKYTHNVDSFIVVSEPVQGDDENWEDYMEYDFSDGRLWIGKQFMSLFTNIFPFVKDRAQEIIRDWFGKKFDVKIEYVHTKFNM